MTPAERALAAVHRRTVELEEAIVVDSIWQEKAADLSYDLAMSSFAYWTNLRREHEELLREFRAIVAAAGPVRVVDLGSGVTADDFERRKAQWHHEAQADREVLTGIEQYQAESR